jgi:hypothetical protein
VIQTNGYNPDDTWTLLCGVTEFNNVQAAYESTYQVPQERKIGGLMLRQIFTRFGILNLALEPDIAGRLRRPHQLRRLRHRRPAGPEQGGPLRGGAAAHRIERQDADLRPDGHGARSRILSRLVEVTRRYDSQPGRATLLGISAALRYSRGGD